MQDKKWICNKCGFESKIEPESHNRTCQNCGRGRFKTWILCDCGKWFHKDKSSRSYCSNECKYRYMPTGGKKGKHYAQRARIAVCPICGKEFRAIKDFKGRHAVYCSKECWAHRGKKEQPSTWSHDKYVWRKAVLKRDNYTCQECGSKERLEAHHIKERCNYPELQFEIDNGICLCHKCHKLTDNYGSKALKLSVQ